ncbi:hypothetical protein POM88_044455 [Heracleum sosnowskyi]|uniref:Uncharacterized protein n=1 Tax=Heracleum sosnowskyi TaxID=360622 RepID=A0AAD8H5D8_9APIA|nr:hypothetical protein POM88_044455 [Heracleum sosnowskyi]
MEHQKQETYKVTMGGREKDLQLALKNDAQNRHLLTIRDIINDVFHPRKENEPNMGTNQESCQQDQQEPPTDEPAYDSDFELRHEEVSQIDLMEYVQSTQKNLDMIPYFSLGIDEDIYVHENDDLITPKPELREKSTRVPKKTWMRCSTDSIRQNWRLWTWCSFPLLHTSISI